MRSLEIGLVLPMGESFVDGSTARWAEVRELIPSRAASSAVTHSPFATTMMTLPRA